LTTFRLHAKPRASDRFARPGRALHLDPGCILAPEEVEQQLARRPDEAGGGIPSPRSNGVGGSPPLQHESCTTQSADEKPAPMTDVAPQGLVHRLLVRARTATVGSAYVLVMDEELVEVREPAHPLDAEEARRRSRSDRRDKRCEIARRERSSSSFGEAAPGAGKDEPRSCKRIVLAEDEVRSEIAGRPRLEERRCVGTELVEQVDELCSLSGVEVWVGHLAGA
jgi:hypothetical protein